MGSSRRCSTMRVTRTIRTSSSGSRRCAVFTTGMPTRTRNTERALIMNKPIDLHPPIQREESWGYDRRIIDYIHHAATHGLYEIRGLGATRKLPHFDDLTFLGASLSRYPLEGYREKCVTTTRLG